MAGTTQYKNNWQKANLDRISLTVPKGHKDRIQGHASVHGESVNSFISRAICEAMERDRLFEENKEEISTLIKNNHVNADIDEQEFKKIVEALTVLASRVPDIKNLYFQQLFFQNHSSRVLVFDKGKLSCPE